MSKFLRVNQNALIEYTYNADNISGDYVIIKDYLNKSNSFSFKSEIDNQLYLVDSTINKYAKVENKSTINLTEYINQNETPFDKIRIWFPLNWTFPNLEGFFINVSTLDFNNSKKYNLINYFIDAKSNSDLSKINISNAPFRLNDKVWGQYIDLYVPSAYLESLNRTGNIPTTGSINSNLTVPIDLNSNTIQSVGLSQNSPIYIDFRFLSKRIIIGTDTSYITQPPNIVSIANIDEAFNLAVSIKEASDGAYFIINGLYNNSPIDFANYLNNLDTNGQRSYIIYSVTVIEDGLPQTTRDIYVYDNYEIGVDDYRPVIKFTNTIAIISVEMKIINSVSGEVRSYITEYVMLNHQINKYGKNPTPIDINKNIIKPKIFNA